MNILVKMVSSGLVILAGPAGATAQSAGWVTEHIGTPVPAPLVVTSSSGQKDAVNSVALVTEPQVGQGSSRQRQASATAPGTNEIWSFLSERDSFRNDALLDLRELNEPIAGQKGFVRVSDDKNGFVRGDGVPLRFWGVNYNFRRNLNLHDLGHSARFLAKRGVNLVRLGAYLPSHGKNPGLTDTDPKSIENTWRLVAAMKNEGIYTTISPYWPSALQHVPKSWGIEGWPEDKSPQGLLFFNPQLQAGYKAWMKALLVPKNPYTGVPLAADPGLAMIHIQNEDSLLWWSEQEIKGKQLELLGKQFAEWAKLKYGSLEAALQKWSGGGMPEDEPARGVLGIQIVWQFTQPRSGGMKKRLDDQLQFFAETMYRFNKEIVRYLREDLGCKQLIIAGNWRPGDSVSLFDAERWSYTAGDVLAVNRYYSPPHVGPDRAWRITKGDQFQNLSALFNPGAFPLAVKQVTDFPMMLTETTWPSPLGCQSEAPFLTAAYLSLTGLDGAFFVDSWESEWSDRDRSEFDAASRYKWAVDTPMLLGQFPAAALMFRRGDISVGEPAVFEHRSLRQIWERVPPVLAEETGYDPNADQGDTAKQSQSAGRVQPLAFLVGPVKVTYDSDPAKTKILDLSRYIDREKKVVRSVNGELTWDYGRGFCTVDAPRAQGATGLLKSIGPIKLHDVMIDSENSYATVLVVSLDSQPLARTSHALVQVGTRARPTGWIDHPVTFTVNKGSEKVSGRQIDSTGKMPWVIDGTRVTIGIHNPNLAFATLLDMNGCARRALTVRKTDETVEVVLPSNAIYVVLSTQAFVKP